MAKGDVPHHPLEHHLVEDRLEEEDKDKEDRPEEEDKDRARTLVMVEDKLIWRHRAMRRLGTRAMCRCKKN